MSTITAPQVLPCGCTLTQRCPAAWQMRTAFAQTRAQGDRPAWRQVITRYTAHVAALYPQWPPGTECWPVGDNTAQEVTV